MVLEFSLPEYKWWHVTQKTTQNQNTLVWCLKPLLTDAFAMLSKNPYPNYASIVAKKYFQDL